MAARLRTGNDREFTSAFWELYLYETYRRDGWMIEIEPDVPGVTTHPDFLVSKNDINYYVEARCTFEGGNNLGASARLQTVYDALDDINSGAFHLAVTTAHIGTQAPATTKLRTELEIWLSQLDPDADDYTLRDDRPERRHEWVQDDWHLVFHPIPRAAAIRGDPAQRPLGVFLPAGASFIDDITPLRDALREKGSKYGDLPHPLVIAINIGSGYHDELDTLQALYGTIGWQLDMDDPAAEAELVLKEPGYWGAPGRPRHRHVAGVLLAEGIHYGRVAQYAPTFWAHPNAKQPVDPLPIWRIARVTDEGTQYSEPTSPAHEHFALPAEWPVGEPFPRRRRLP